MRLAVVVLVVGCGRIDFAARTDATDALDPDALGDAAATGFTRLIVDSHMTCGLLGGDVYCWGNSVDGQIGTFGQTLEPTKVAFPAGTIADVTIGDTHLCAIVDGTVWCAGKIDSPSVRMPRAIALAGTQRAVTAGREFTCALSDVVQCWGLNDLGQLGIGDEQAHPTPVTVNFGGAQVMAIDAGDDHTCALLASNSARCWGHNDDGALGTGSMTPTVSPVPVAVSAPIKTLPAIAGWHACALEGDAVYCWGRGDSGELGGSTSSATPILVNLAGPATAVATGGGPAEGDANCAIVDGAVWCWGKGGYGRLGNGLGTNSATPVEVPGLPARAVEVGVGYNHACARLVDGDIWCWGRGDLGQLGDGAGEHAQNPVRAIRP